MQKRNATADEKVDDYALFVRRCHHADLIRFFSSILLLFSRSARD
jgi:hypothetical protein